MKKLFFVLLFLCSVAFAAPIDDVEKAFQKGLQLGNQGNIEEALQEFQKVVAADQNNLPKDYYFQTVREAYFNIGLLQSKKGDLREGNQSYQKALRIDPKHAKSLYYLAINSIVAGEIAQAATYYNQAKALGFTKDPQQPSTLVADPLAVLTQRSITIDYQSYFDHNKRVMINVEGNPIGENQLIHDAIGGIERVLKISGFGLFSRATVEYIRERNKTIDIERWNVQGEGWEKTLWVKYDFAPPAGFPYKVMIEVSEMEIN